jgi:hypothetical protein
VLENDVVEDDILPADWQRGKIELGAGVNLPTLWAHNQSEIVRRLKDAGPALLPREAD